MNTQNYILHIFIEVSLNTIIPSTPYSLPRTLTSLEKATTDCKSIKTVAHLLESNLTHVLVRHRVQPLIYMNSL